MIARSKYLVHIGRMVYKVDLSISHKIFSHSPSTVMNFGMCSLCRPRARLFHNFNLNLIFSYFKCIKALNYQYFHDKTISIQPMLTDVRILSTVAKINSVEPRRSYRVNHSLAVVKNENLKRIEETFKCSQEEAYILMKLNRTLLHFQNELSIIKVQEYQKSGLTLNTIKNNLWILSYNESEFKFRINELAKWNFQDINSGVQLMKMPLKKFNFYTLLATQDPVLLGKNRILYFADELKCHEAVACNIFVNHKFLLSMKVKVFQTKLRLHLDAGIKPENLLTDVYNFRYSSEWIIEKINKIKSSKEYIDNQLDLKPWMLRCLKPVLERTFELQTMNKKAILPYNNVVEFLCKELDISKFQVDLMMRIHPPLTKVNEYKLKEIIDFLKEEGIDMILVFKRPRILCHSLNTIKERLTLLRSLDYDIQSLQILCKNRKDFEQTLANLTKANKLKNNEVPN